MRTKPQYIVIIGQGRSGTKWLANLFDLSSTTHVRNEPNVETSKFPKLNPYKKIDGFDVNNEMEKYWDEAVEHSSSLIGDRDLPIIAHKNHLYPWARTVGFHKIMCSRRCRKYLRFIYPPFKNELWKLPSLVGNQRQMEEALTVIKLVQTAAWGTFVLRNRKNVMVSHIIRHPGGFLASWYNRHVKVTEKNLILSKNLARLKKVANSSNYWSNLFGDIDRMDIYESELWYWRYANELVITTGEAQNPEFFSVVVFEDLATKPIPIVKKLYDQAGLEFTNEIKTMVSNNTRNSESIATKWRSQLKPKQIQLVESFLNDSLLGKFWVDK